MALAYVLISFGVGEAASKHSAAKAVDFDLPAGFDSRPLESEIEAADPGKKASKPHFLAS
jgi:hypothetical protein